MEKDEQKLLLCLNFDDIRNPWKDKCGNIFTVVLDKNSNIPTLSNKYFITGRHSYLVSNKSYIQCDNLNFDLNALDNWTIEFWIFIPDTVEDPDLKIFTIKLFDKSIVLNTTSTIMNFVEGRRSTQAVKYENMYGRFYNRSIVKTVDGINHYWDGYLLSKTIVGTGSSTTIQNLLLNYKKNDMIIGGDSDVNIEDGIFCYLDSIKIYGSNNYSGLYYNPEFFQYNYNNTKRFTHSIISYKINTIKREAIDVKFSCNIIRNNIQTLELNNNTYRNIYYNLSGKEKFTVTKYYYNFDNYQVCSNSTVKIILNYIYTFYNVRNVIKDIKYIINSIRNIKCEDIIKNLLIRYINKDYLINNNLKRNINKNIINFNNTQLNYISYKYFNTKRNILYSIITFTSSIRLILKNIILKYNTQRKISFDISSLIIYTQRKIIKNNIIQYNIIREFIKDNLLQYNNTQRKINFTYYDLLPDNPLYNSIQDNKPKFNTKILFVQNFKYNYFTLNNIIITNNLQFNISRIIYKNIISKFNARYNCGSDIIPVSLFTNTQRNISCEFNILHNCNRIISKQINSYNNTKIYLAVNINLINNSLNNIIITNDLQFNISRNIYKNIINKFNTRYNCGSNLIPISLSINTYRDISCKFNILYNCKRNIIKDISLYNNTIFNNIINVINNNTIIREIIFKYTNDLQFNTSYNININNMINNSIKRTITKNLKYNYFILYNIINTNNLQFNISRIIYKNIISKFNIRYNCGYNLIPVYLFINTQRDISCKFNINFLSKRSIIKQISPYNKTEFNQVQDYENKFINTMRKIVFKYTNDLKFNIYYSIIKIVKNNIIITRKIIFKYINDLQFNISRNIHKNIINKFNTRYNCGSSIIPISLSIDTYRDISCKFNISYNNKRYITKDISLHNNIIFNNIINVINNNTITRKIIFKYTNNLQFNTSRNIYKIIINKFNIRYNCGSNLIPTSLSINTQRNILHKFNILYNNKRNIIKDISLYNKIIFNNNISIINNINTIRKIIFKYTNDLQFNISRNIHKNIINKFNTRYNCGNNIIQISLYINTQRNISCKFNISYNCKRNIIKDISLHNNTIFNNIINVINNNTITRKIIFKYTNNLQFNTSCIIHKNIINKFNTRYNCGSNLIPTSLSINTQRNILHKFNILYNCKRNIIKDISLYTKTKQNYIYKKIINSIRTINILYNISYNNKRYITKNIFLHNNIIFNNIINIINNTTTTTREIIFKYINDLQFNTSRNIHKIIISKFNTRYNCGNSIIPTSLFINTQRNIACEFDTLYNCKRYITKDISLFNNTIFNNIINVINNTITTREIIFKYINDLQFNVSRNIHRTIINKFNTRYNYGNNIISISLFINIQRNILHKFNILYNCKRNIIKDISLHNNIIFNNIINIINNTTIIRKIIFKYINNLQFNTSRNIHKNIINKFNTRYNCGNSIIPTFLFINTQRNILHKFNIFYHNKRNIIKDIFLYNNTIFNNIINVINNITIIRKIIFKYTNNLQFNTSRNIHKNIINKFNTRYNCGNNIIQISLYINTQRNISYKFNILYNCKRNITKNISLHNKIRYLFIFNIIKISNCIRKVLFYSIDKDGNNLLPAVNTKRFINKYIKINFNLKLITGTKNIIIYINTIYRASLIINDNVINTYRKIYYKKDFKYYTKRYIQMDHPLYNRDYNMDRKVVAYVFNPDYVLKPEFINVPYLPNK